MNFARLTVATTIGILALLAAASIAGCPAGSSPGGTSQTAVAEVISQTAVAEVIFDNGNAELVANSPTAAAKFTTQRTYRVTLIRNYHWNDGAGSAGVGTIALRDAAGTTYGPWPAVGSDGGGGTSKNLSWEAAPDTRIPPGTYTVIDSDTATWAQNATTGNAGMTHVEGVRVATSGDDGTSGDGTSGDGDADTNRNAHPNRNADSNGDADANRHTHGDRNPDRHPNRDRDSDPDGDGHPDCVAHSDTDPNRDADANRHTHRDSNANRHPNRNRDGNTDSDRYPECFAHPDANRYSATVQHAHAEPNRRTFPLRRRLQRQRRRCRQRAHHDGEHHARHQGHLDLHRG